MADGLTKQLNGQAFFRFVEDLGIKRSTSMKLEVPQMTMEKVNLAEVMVTER